MSKGLMLLELVADTQEHCVVLPDYTPLDSFL
jgi:hypothetical protein